MPETTSTMAQDARDPRPPRPDAGLVLIFATGWKTMPRGFLLSDPSHTIGREPGHGGLVVPQNAVSRLHAVLQRDGDVVLVKDLGSHNGTFVNGTRVEATTLSDGDDIRIGDALFKFVAGDARAHLAYGLDGSVAVGGAPVTIEGVVGGLSMARVSAAVRASARTDASVLISGETGVGKELVAHAVHAATRPSGPFVAINCAALPPNLIESELFGHRKGAFTGAGENRQGLFRAAQRGTIFLDEIGDLPLDSQGKLLRVLETREVISVGDTRPSTVDVRVVSATHRDLLSLVQNGRFRADLYARVAAFLIHVPTLRSRKEDMYLLVRHFLRAAGVAEASIGFPFVHQLCRHDWPLNVRELANAIKRAVALADGRELRAADLPTRSRQSSSGAPARRGRKAPSADDLSDLLRRHEGNVSAVGRALDRDPAQIYRWLKRFGIDPDTFRTR